MIYEKSDDMFVPYDYDQKKFKWVFCYQETYLTRKNLHSRYLYSKS